MKYHNITHDDMRNGDGLRVVLWLSGCSHHCKGCHNPMTWNPDDGLEFDEKAKEEIFEQLSQEYISGITFSGGDPLHENNVMEVEKLIEEIREKFPKKDIWLYSGYTFNYLKSSEKELDKTRLKVVKLVDVFVDGPFIEALKDVNYQWAGSTNQKVIYKFN